MTMGEIIRTIRLRRGMRQRDLAARLYVTPQAISRWERSCCSPDISQIVPLARALGTTPDVLFGVSPLPEP